MIQTIIVNVHLVITINFILKLHYDYINMRKICYVNMCKFINYKYYMQSVHLYVIYKI